MILGFLWSVLKVLLIICGILIILNIIVELIKMPFETRKKQQNAKEFINALNNAVEEAIKEIEKEEEAKKTTTKKKTKKKEN